MFDVVIPVFNVKRFTKQTRARVSHCRKSWFRYASHTGDVLDAEKVVFWVVLDFTFFGEVVKGRIYLAM